MPHITKAIILAAGPGSRLLPHTAHSPKCLTPIGGQPILRYQLAALRRCGVDDVVIVVGYLSDRIRDYVDSSVTLVENRDFAATNSSYSLWLARNHMRQGFIHLNSDLLFEPELLRALLASPDENAVIVDRRVSAGSDMMKAQMDGARILRMGKQLTTDAAAEVVGPAKFGASGAELLIDNARAAHRGGRPEPMGVRCVRRPRAAACVRRRRQPRMFLGRSRYRGRQAGRPAPHSPVAR